jgi:hypothetical protein
MIFQFLKDSNGQYRVKGDAAVLAIGAVVEVQKKGSDAPILKKVRRRAVCLCLMLGLRCLPRLSQRSLPAEPAGPAGRDTMPGLHARGARPLEVDNPNGRPVRT